MLLFADADFVQCLIQFGVVGLFMLMSLVSWVIKQAGARNTNRPEGAAPQRRVVVPSAPKRRENVYAAEVIDASLADRPDGPRIRSTLSTTDLAEHAAHLGHLDDRPAEKGIHDQFDDELGRLGDSSDAIHEDPDADKLPDVAVTTSEIVEVFRHPERIREAIVLNEILTRPEERW